MSSLPPRLTTGVPGLDEILYGGLRPHNVYLLEGDPGTGKTTLALQFLLSGIERGEPGLLLALSESKNELADIAASHDWNLGKIHLVEVVPAEAQLNPDETYTFFHPEEIELADTVQMLNDEIERARPARVVVDSLAELRLLSSDSRQYRRQILALKQHLTRKQITVLLLDDRTSAAKERQLHSVVHGVISLERLPREYGKMRRRVEVSKMRGSPFIEGFHDYLIETGGVKVFPRLVAAKAENSTPDRRVLRSGIAELDTLLGGGIDQGSATLIAGPAGSGKTTLALQYAIAEASPKDVVSMYTFEEGRPSVITRAESLNMPLQAALAEGRIELTQIDPAELSPGEFADRVRRSVEHKKVRTVIIDSLNGYLAAMPQEEFLTLQMHELLTYLNQNGVATILILAQHGVFDFQSAVNLSYLADTIVLLRFFEAHGEVRKAVSVMKKRSSAHERVIREMDIVSGQGIRVGSPLTAFRGILTGVPEYTGDSISLRETPHERR